MQNHRTENLSILSDSIQWPKDFPELKLIDDALRCGICYEYIRTCMVTPCAHSYCSICIRKSLMYKTACPTCFEETFETSLRNNRVLDRVIELFVTIKDNLIKYIRVAAIHFNSKEIQSPAASHLKVDKPKPQAVEVTPKRSVERPLKSSTKGKINFPPTASASSSKKSEISKRLEDILGSPKTSQQAKNDLNLLVSEIENDNSKFTTVPSMFLQPKVENAVKVDEPFVECPVCCVNIPERNINAHLDNCLANKDKPVKSIFCSSPVVKQKRNPLPKMVWSLMAEKDLRKKLKEYGLNTQGDKKALISRIQRYILLYNSECDTDNPKPVSEIIRQVEKEEKQPAVQNQQRLVITKKTDPKIIEEENQKYIQENKDSFKKLIEAMKSREGRNIKPVVFSNNKILSDDEAEISSDEKCSKEASSEKTIWNGRPSTSKEVVNIDLCDSNDGCLSPLSPVLGSVAPDDNKLCNGYESESSEDVLIPQSNKKSKNFADQKISPRKSQETANCKSINERHEFSDNNSNSSPDFVISPCSLPSPSRIITNHSEESEDSISILINQNIDEDLFEEEEEPTENIPPVDSQLQDPDFLINTELVENCSEEVFIPRKSKRKHNSLVDSKPNTSPRRTRRRVKP